jgi:hypothetical protein
MGERGSEKWLRSIFFDGELDGVSDGMQHLLGIESSRAVRRTRLVEPIGEYDRRWLTMQQLAAGLPATPRAPRLWLIDPYFDDAEL